MEGGIQAGVGGGGGAGTHPVGAGSDLYSAVDFAAAPAIRLGGPGGHPGSQLANRRGPAGPRLKDALSAGPVGCRGRRGAESLQGTHSAAPQQRAPPRSPRALRCSPLPFLPTLLPFPRQQNLGSRLFVREGVFVCVPGPRAERVLGLCCGFPRSASHCGKKEEKTHKTQQTKPPKSEEKHPRELIPEMPLALQSSYHSLAPVSIHSFLHEISFSFFF